MHRRPAHHVHAASDGQIAGAGVEAVAGTGDGDQRRRACGVDRQTRPAQIQHIGDARGEDRGSGAGEALRAQAQRLRGLVVIAGTAADEDSTLAGRKRLRRVPGVFDRVPAGFQEQALLRVHRFRFGRRDAEEQRIKAVVIVQRAQPLAVGLACGRRAGSEIFVERPTRVGDFADAAATGGEVGPIGIDVFGVRELTGDTNHCDGICCTRCAPGGGRRRRKRRINARDALTATAPGHQRRARMRGGDHTRARRCGQHRLRRHGLRLRRDGRRQRAGLFGFAQHQPADLVESRMAVDLGRLDRDAELRIDLAHPGHAGDRIQTHVDEWCAVFDLIVVQMQFGGEQRADLRDHAAQARAAQPRVVFDRRRADHRRDRTRRQRRYRCGHRRCRYRRRGSRRCGDRCAPGACGLDHQPPERLQRRMAVDLGRFDHDGVFGIDPTHPGHAGDRIQTEIDEWRVVVDLFRFEEQFLRQHRTDAVDDDSGRQHGGGAVGRGSMLRGRCDGRGLHGRRRELCRRRLRAELALDRAQRLGVVDEGFGVHRHFAGVRVLARVAQRLRPQALERDQACARLARDAARQRQRGLQHVATRQHRHRHRALLERMTRDFLRGQQRLAR